MSETKNLIIYTDGGARGNPGPAGIGIVICSTGGKCKKFSQYIGKTTNNQAEYRALIFALEKAKKLNPQKITCYLDSELVCRQLNGFYKIKNKALKPLFQKVEALASQFQDVNFLSIPREKNRQADKLVNKAIDQVIQLKNKNSIIRSSPN